MSETIEIQEQSQLIETSAKTDNTKQTSPVSDPQEQIPPFIKSEENKENWKKFKAAREQERKAREIAEKAALEEKARADAIQKAMEVLVNKPSPIESNDEDQKISMLVQNQVSKALEKIENERRAKEQAEAPSRLRRDCPDFDQVCNQDNLDYLDYHYPEISSSFEHMPEGVEKWKAIYGVAKKLVPQTDIKKDQQRIEQNLKKPQSFSSSQTLQGKQGNNPTHLSDERKMANWERMQRQLKGLSSGEGDRLL